AADAAKRTGGPNDLDLVCAIADARFQKRAMDIEVALGEKTTRACERADLEHGFHRGVRGAAL
ncbi:MAG: hypothetical protein ABI612_14080, partial [Betaproteobacteria bacterium]